MNEKEDIYKKVELDECVELIFKLQKETEENRREIEKSKKKIAELEADTTYQRGLDRERIKMFDDYIDLKGKGRRDYDNLAIKLRHEILTRRRGGMDYRDVFIFFGFKSNEEAYRVMDRTKGKFPEDVKMREIKNSNKRKKILCPR